MTDAPIAPANEYPGAPESLEVTASPTYAPEAPLLVEAAPLEYADFGIRFAARLIDLVLIYALSFATNFVGAVLIVTSLRVLHQPLQSAIQNMGTTSALSYAAALAAGVAYYVVADGLHGSTPGKMVLGLTVRAKDGGFCRFGSAVGRELGYFIDSLFFGMPAYFTMKSNPEQQRLGDKWAGTVVVRTRSLPPQERRQGGTFVYAAAAACFAYGAIIFAELVLKI